MRRQDYVVQFTQFLTDFRFVFKDVQPRAGDLLCPQSTDEQPRRQSGPARC